MVRLTRRQRLAVTALGVANLIAATALGVLLLRGTPRGTGAMSELIPDPQRLRACREATSRALLNAGQAGLVQTRQDSTLVIQIQTDLSQHNARGNADAAVWTALEAAANHGECFGFRTVEIAVLLSPSNDVGCAGGTCQGLRAMARVGVTDLLLWSLGDMDDAELARRLDYTPPTTSSPAFLEVTVTP